MDKKQTHVTYGIINGIALIITSLVFYLTGLSYHKYFNLLVYLPFLVILILNALAFSKANDGYVTFPNIYGSCFKVALVTCVFSLAWGISTLYAFPEMKTKALEMMRIEMAKQPNVTDDMIDSIIGVYTKFWSTIIVLGSVLGPIISGALLGLVAAAIPPKKGERPFTADNF